LAKQVEMPELILLWILRGQLAVRAVFRQPIYYKSNDQRHGALETIMKHNNSMRILVLFILLILTLVATSCAEKSITSTTATFQATREVATAVFLSPLQTPISPVPTPEPPPALTAERTEPEYTVSNGLQAESFSLPLYTLFFWTGMTWDGDQHIWIVNNQLRIVADFYIEKGTGDRVISLPDDLKKSPWVTGLTWDGSNFWVSDLENEMIYQIDPITGKRLDGFAYGGTPTGLEWVDGSLYIISMDRLALEKVTPTGERQLSLAIQATWPTGLAWDGKYFWYSDGYDGTISILNPVTGKSTKLDEIKFITNVDTFNGLTWINDYLWVVTEADDRLHRFDVSQLDWKVLDAALQ
jgi:hypothetical protein